MCVCVCIHIYITAPSICIQSLSWYNVPWKHWQVGYGIWVNHCTGHLEETWSIWQAFKSWRWSELRLKSICLAAFCSKTCLLSLQPWSLNSLVLTLRCSESPDKCPIKCIRQGQGAPHPLLLCRLGSPAACSDALSAANSMAGCSLLELCPLASSQTIPLSELLALAAETLWPPEGEILFCSPGTASHWENYKLQNSMNFPIAGFVRLCLAEVTWK